VGGGPIGLALAAELSTRGVPAVLIDERRDQHGDAQVGTAKMIVVSMRTAEFCRRLGLSPALREWGFPLDHGMDSIFVTSMQGWELGRVRTPTLAEEAFGEHSPERDRPCPQTWFDPILRNYVRRVGVVELRYDSRLSSFEQDEGGVTARIVDTTSGEEATVRAKYLIGCDGYHSTVRSQLGIDVSGEPHLDTSMSVYVRIPELGRYHDKGDAYRYVGVSAAGTWAALTTIDGRDLYRLQLIGANDIDVHAHDLGAVLRRFLGPDVPFTVEDVSVWERKMTVASRFSEGRVFLAGDSAHAHPPNGGLGMNTGIPDAWDLGWKLSAVLEGWGGPGLLEAYDVERRPACRRAAAQSLRNYHSLVGDTNQSAIEDPSAEGQGAREEMGRRLVEENEKVWNPVGIHLGYLYHPSPLVIDDGSPVPPDDPYGYAPSARPGARAPHIWLDAQHSILDVFGLGFTLLDFGAEDAHVLAAAAHQRGVPVTVVPVDHAGAAALYERKLVLVRPDGHVAWRGDQSPSDPLDVIDAVRGAL
jgi:2-polyprenyl-6-methoxyphenol hydroxylase-like FAD-dependent oxidoreductase